MEESKLIDAIAEANARLQEQGVNVQGGKKYLMVKDRVIIFRHYFGEDYGIDTRLIQADNERVVVQAMIVNADGSTIGSGLGEEHRDTRGVNSTSALENAETSAIGRALASLGLHGGEYASADEMVNAISQQANSAKTINKPTDEIFDKDWQNTIVVNGKNKGKKLGELETNSLKWYIENWQPWRGDDGQGNPPETHIEFRNALDSAKQSVFSDGSDIDGQSEDEQLDEEVPF